MAIDRPRPTRVPTKYVVFGIIILAGVLAMAYGYYQNSLLAIYFGAALALLGALNTVLPLIVHTDLRNTLRHPR